MANSVNTNYGAIVALQSLNRTNSDLASVQKRVSTGYRVNDAIDDGAAFSVAQGLRSTVKGLESVNERLSAAKGLLSVTQEGLKGVSDSIADAKKVLVKLADGNLSSAERTQYNADYAALKTEITNYVAQSTFNGSSLLGSTDVKIIFDAKGGQFTLTAQNTSGSIAAGMAAVADATAAAAALTASGALATFESAVNASLSTVGGFSRSVENQAEFVSIITDATNTGIGSIVDADLAKESARLQSLQIRQQLGTQSLSIANQSPSILLSLFK